MRGLRAVFTLSSLTRESPLPVSETPWLAKKNIAHTILMTVHEEDCNHEDGCHPVEEELAAE